MQDGITWVGLDAHKSFIQVAVKLPEQSDFVEWRVDRPDNAAAKKLARRLVRMAPGEVRCCYEAGPCGYWLKRIMEDSAPAVVEVIAPSLIPVKAGERVKTDRKDARKLANYLSTGQLTVVRPPSEAEESVRDLCRLRDDLREDHLRCRHRLSKWLLRRGLHFPGKSKNWSKAHMDWMRSLCFEDSVMQTVLDQHLTALEETQSRLADVTNAISMVAETPEYARRVTWLRAFHGIDTLSAMLILSELHDIRRFQSARELMSYLGLTPSEHSSGGKRKGGGITKTGNRHVRRVLVEAAWHYRHRVHEGRVLRQRREAVPTSMVSVARKAHHRLTRRRRVCTARGMPASKVNAAIARELAGFIWDVLRQEAGTT